MASAENLDERFQAAVRAVQQLPADGEISARRQSLSLRVKFEGFSSRWISTVERHEVDVLRSLQAGQTRPSQPGFSTIDIQLHQSNEMVSIALGGLLCSTKDSSRDAWDKCRLMTREAAMSKFIDEIRSVSDEQRFNRR